MDKDIQKMLRERMKNADLENLFPDIDKEAEWEQLSARLNGKRKSIPLIWMYAAAAALSGIMVGALMMKFSLNQNLTTPILTTKTIKTKPVVISAMADTNEHVVSRRSQVPFNTPPALRTIVADNSELRLDSSVVTVQPPLDTTAIILKQTEIASVHRQAPTPAIHLLDLLKDDDRNAILQNDKTAPNKPIPVYVNRSRPHNNEENGASSLVQGIFNY